MGRPAERLTDRVGALGDVFRSPPLRRLQLAWGGFYSGEWAHFVALSVYAYEQGGAAAVGVLGLVRMIPAAVALPLGSMLVDRYSRRRVLLGVHVSRAAVLGSAAAVLALDGPTALVFALAGLAAVTAAPFRPALQASLARTPQELVATTVSGSTLEGLATLAGPAPGGVVAQTAGVDVAVGAGAAV